MRLQLYRDLDELAGLRCAWDELLSEYPLSTTFSTWEWLSSWWRCFSADRELLVLAAFDTGESLVGLAPFSLASEPLHSLPRLRLLRLLGDGTGDSDNLDFPVRPGFERPFAEAVVENLSGQSSQWDLCEFNTLPINSPVAEWVLKFARAKRWTCLEYLSGSSAISLPQTWEEYAATISAEDRKNLVRYTQRLYRRYATRIYRCNSEEELPRCLEALFRLHQERWLSAGEPGCFSSSERRTFYHQLSRCLLQRNWLELWVLELSGDIAAVQFAFRYRDTVFQLQEGYDHNRPADRTGYVLRGEVIKQLINERVRKYDFLGGEDGYKMRWAAERGSYRRIWLARPLTAASVLLRSVDRAERSKNWLRSRLPTSLWQILHKVKVSIRGIPDKKLGSGKPA